MTDQEINEAVARKLGHRIGPDKNGIVRGVIYQWTPTENMPDYVREIPDYCHSIEAAWEIWEKLLDLNYDLQLYSSWDRRRIVCFHATEKAISVNEYPPRQLHGEADTAPIAICLAFLKLDRQEREGHEVLEREAE